MLRWGSELGVSRHTRLRIIHSWVDDDWPTTWPLAVGFCGAESELDHAFWFLPFARCAGARLVPRHRPLPSELGWHVASAAQAQTEASLESGNSATASRIFHCFICDVLEVAPNGPAPQYFRQRWARPCGCKAMLLAHRSCLEKKLREAIRSECSSSSGTTSLHCQACGDRYTTTTRFPDNIYELIWSSLLEWKWVLRRIFCIVVCFIWMYTLALQYCSAIFRELGLVLLFTAALMGITMTPRFHFCVKVIWNTPNRVLYFRLFALMSVMLYSLLPRAVDPSLWASAAAKHSYLMRIHSIHESIHTSRVGTVLLSGVSLIYLATASGIIFLFWKTSVRVPTVASVWSTQDKGCTACSLIESANGDGGGCGLCRLGLCLDNNFM